MAGATNAFGQPLRPFKQSAAATAHEPAPAPAPKPRKQRAAAPGLRYALVLDDELLICIDGVRHVAALDAVIDLARRSA